MKHSAIMAFVVTACLLLMAPAALAESKAPHKVLDVVQIRAPEGAEAWLVEDHSVPVISMSFSFEGGLAYDPPEKPGVGRLVSILLDEGSGDMKSQAYQQKLSDNAISLSFSAGRDDFTGELKTLRANKDIAFDLLAQALTKPRFDNDAIERMKNVNAAEIRDNMGDGSWLLARTFNGMVFENHYYAIPGFGDLVSMQTITRQDLIDFTKAQFARGVLKVSIAGDISGQEAEDALRQIFGSLPKDAEGIEEQQTVLSYTGKTILLPLDTPQTYVLMGDAGVARNSPDWAAATILNYIIGGGSFDSRLMKEIRVKRGLTYGVQSSLSSMKYASLLQVSMSASNDKVPEALSVLRQEWQKLAQEGPTAQEVAGAKSYLTGSILLGLASTSAISGTLNGLQQDGLDIDYINQYTAMINAVTVEDVKHIAEKLLDADRLTTVLVGKPANINPDILLDTPPGMRENP